MRKIVLTAHKSVFRAALARAARGRSASSLAIHSPSRSATREAPTPVVFTSGLLHTAAAWEAHSSLPVRLRNSGFTTAFLDLPGYGRAPAGWNPAASIDDLVADLRATIGKLHVPPVLVASSVTACLFQKYLESHALAGFILLSPLPPDPRRWLQRVCKLSDEAAVNSKHVASWLRRSAASEEGAASLWLGNNPGETEAQALFASVEELAGSPADDNPGNGASTARVCGFEAAASWLAKLAAEPVNLEPQPVPMAAIFGGADACLHNVEVSPSVTVPFSRRLHSCDDARETHGVPAVQTHKRELFMAIALTVVLALSRRVPHPIECHPIAFRFSAARGDSFFPRHALRG